VELSLAALVFAPALAVGSFLNVVAARLPRHQSLVRPGSHCDECGGALAWYDNVPLVSYAVLRGRCRHCGTKYGVRYLAVELATALLVAAVFAHFGLRGEAFVAAFFVACLVVLSAIDIEHRILPDVIVLPATAIVLAAQIALSPERAVEWTLAAVGAAGFLFLALLAYPRGMGMGDVKLALLMGAALGKPVAVAMMLGMVTALAVGVALLARHGSAARKTAIPFGPFLAAGSIVAVFAGERLLSEYLGLF
jgi:prepilin signal peptidase PulO-like enzyme (type II secretory pathway)